MTPDILRHDHAIRNTTTDAVIRTIATSGLVDDWTDYLTQLVDAAELSQDTSTTYRVGLRKYLGWSLQFELQPHEQSTVLAWIASLRSSGCKPASINTWLAGVRAFWRWLADIGVVNTSPLTRIRSQRRSGTSRRHSRTVLTTEEVRRLLSAPDDSVRGRRDRAILHLLAYNALRKIELCRAELQHLRTVSNRLVLDVHGKGHRSADEWIVIANSDAVTAVYDWLSVRGMEPGALFWSMSRSTLHQPLAQRSMAAIVRNYFGQVGIFEVGKTAHSLRHTAITNAISNGAPPHKVQSMARHANLATTMIYYHEIDRLERPAEDFISYNR